MFDDLKDVFRNVLDLTYNVRRVDKDWSVVSVNEFFNPDIMEISKEQDALDSYFNSLDFATIKTLQCIMYLGRDEDHDSNDIPEVIYEKQQKYFDDSIGWNTKEIEINQMTEKSPVLYDYFKNGFKILKIQIEPVKNFV